MLKNLTRKKLKEMLSQCTEEQQMFFKRTHAGTSHNAGVVIDTVIDEMDINTVVSALNLVKRTLDKNKEGR